MQIWSKICYNKSMSKFATAINCMDGRTQLPVINFLKENYDVDFIDMITEAGPVKLLAEKSNQALVDSIFKRCDISVNKHSSTLIAVVAHHDCAGNPIPKEEQIKQCQLAIKLVKEKFTDIKVIGLWIDTNWQVSNLDKP